MFVNAIKLVSSFTHPVIISKRLDSGKVECGCATFIVLNSDGWVLTASHVFNDQKLFNQQKEEREKREKSIAAIENDTLLFEKQKKRKISQIPKTPNHILNISYWWGANNIQMGQMIGNDLVDLAAVKLSALPPMPADSFPVFNNPSPNFADLPVGRSLCRTGFPFHNIEATFDDTNGLFTLAPGTLPVPRFPNECMLTRGMVLNNEKKQTANFIETSTPGLRGQSGGPIFDVSGRIWGIQSHTKHLSLGFSPKLKDGNKEFTEHQFLNVGIGVYVSEVIKFAQENNININVVN